MGSVKDNDTNEGQGGDLNVGLNPDKDTFKAFIIEDSGGLRIGTTTDLAGRQNFNTVFGDVITANRHADVEEQFQYNISDKTLTTTTVGNGASSQENAMMKISTGTTTTGSCVVESKRVIRYRPGFEAWAYFTALWDNGGVAGSKQYIGASTDGDGYFVGYDGTDFVVGRRYATTDTTVTSSSWNGDGYFATNFDNTKLNIFRISYGWLGIAQITFEYAGQDGKWHVIHQMRIPNTLTQPSSANPQLPIRIEATKTAGATDIVMHTDSWAGGINGDDVNAGDRYFLGHNDATVTTQKLVLNIENQSTFQSKTNRVVMELQMLDLATDGNKTVEWVIYKNLSIATPSWSNVDANNSVARTDIAGTPTFVTANQEFRIGSSKVDSQIIDLRGLGLFLYPGETLTVSAQSATSNIVHCAVRWAEKF